MYPNGLASAVRMAMAMSCTSIVRGSRARRTSNADVAPPEFEDVISTSGRAPSWIGPCARMRPGKSCKTASQTAEAGTSLRPSLSRTGCIYMLGAACSVTSRCGRPSSMNSMARNERTF